jgi:predicted phosphate transport protein (TIGR00153 family)
LYAHVNQAEAVVRSIASLFGKSPFGPLAQHAEQVRETVALVKPLFEAFLAGDGAETRRLYEQISKLEHRADNIKNDIREHLPKSLLMPVDRGDVLLFLKEQDRLADRAEDLGVLLTMRETPAPAELHEAVRALVTAVLAAANEWFKVAASLTRLEEASFAGSEVDRVMEQIRRISNLEWEADKRQAEAGTLLFRHEDEIGAVSVFFWMRIFRVLGSVADHAENTADLLRVMIAKR